MGGRCRLARLIEEAKREGEVHYVDAVVAPKTQAGLDRAFRRKYGLPESLWVGAPAFFKAAAKDGHLLPYVAAEWKHYDRVAKRLGVEADPPPWITPSAYSFVPAWNRKCPGFASVQIKSWKDLLDPAFRGKMIIGDVRKSFTYAATWVGMEGALGKEYFPKFVELTQPAIFFRTEESLHKVISCEYPIQIWQSPGRVFQRSQEIPGLDVRLAWPEEGVVLVAVRSTS